MLYSWAMIVALAVAPVGTPALRDPWPDGAVVAPKASNAAAPFVVKRVLRLQHPFRHGDYAWDNSGVPAGPLVITADLEAETLSVLRSGYEIGTAAILCGARDHPTPLGTFPITEKDADHVSNIYHAPMPYMLRLTNDGVAIHGSEVDWGGSSHGCLGVPVAFAKLLFEQACVGDRVYITEGRFIDSAGTSNPAG